MISLYISMEFQISSWTPAHEQILKEWKAKAFVYLWLQSNSCYYYVRLYNWLAYTVIVFSSFASATMFSLTSSPDGCTTHLLGIHIGIVQYIIGTVSLLSALLTGVIRQLRPGEMYQQHATMSKRYHTLIRSIDVCLSLIDTLRPDPAMFIERVGLELDNLANNQVDPPLRIIKLFEKTYGPLERILYGEDVVELWKLACNTSRIEKRFRKSIELGDGATSRDSSDDKDDDNVEVVIRHSIDSLANQRSHSNPGIHPVSKVHGIPGGIQSVPSVPSIQEIPGIHNHTLEDMHLQQLRETNMYPLRESPQLYPLRGGAQLHHSSSRRSLDFMLNNLKEQRPNAMRFPNSKPT
jgi:hypothetical protein